MRIDGSKPTQGVTTSKTAKRASGGNVFELPRGGQPAQPQATTASAGIDGIDALLALQSVDDPGARRRKAVKRGHDMLDELDRLKIALLEGSLPHVSLRRLQIMVQERPGALGDPALDGLLAEIDLRVMVELAKRETRPTI